MSNTQTTDAPAHFDANFWSTLGLDYQHAFGDDPKLIAAVQKWLSHLPPLSCIFECGCGTGVPIARTIVDKGYKYHGIDFAEGMVDVCRHQVPEAEHLEKADMLSYEPGRVFDGVVASLSFMELSREEQTRMAGRWASWLRPGGYFLLSTITAEEERRDGYGDQGEGVWHQESGCVSDIPTTFMGNSITVTLFTQRGWKQLIDGAGLEIVSTDTDFFEPKVGPREPRFYVIARKGGGE